MEGAMKWNLFNIQKDEQRDIWSKVTSRSMALLVSLESLTKVSPNNIPTL
jgi:hypothetical protein